MKNPIKPRKPGAGRKPLPEGERRVSRSVTLSQESDTYIAAQVAAGARSPGHVVDALIASLRPS